MFGRDGCKINADKNNLKNKDRLDDFCFNQRHIDQFKELGSILKILVSIFHNYSSGERSFILNNAILKDNIEQKSIIS